MAPDPFNLTKRLWSVRNKVAGCPNLILFFFLKIFPFVLPGGRQTKSINNLKLSLEIIYHLKNIYIYIIHAYSIIFIKNFIHLYITSEVSGVSPGNKIKFGIFHLKNISQFGPASPLASYSEELYYYRYWHYTYVFLFRNFGIQNYIFNLHKINKQQLSRKSVQWVYTFRWFFLWTFLNSVKFHP